MPEVNLRQRIAPRWDALAEIRVLDIRETGPVIGAMTGGRCLFACGLLLVTLGSCATAYRSRGELPPEILPKFTWFEAAKTRKVGVCSAWRIRPTYAVNYNPEHCTRNVVILGKVTIEERRTKAWYIGRDTDGKRGDSRLVFAPQEMVDADVAWASIVGKECKGQTLGHEEFIDVLTNPLADHGRCYRAIISATMIQLLSVNEGLYTMTYAGGGTFLVKFPGALKSKELYGPYRPLFKGPFSYQSAMGRRTVATFEIYPADH